MQVEHPYAGEGDGVPPAQVDVDGDARAVEDGTFEVHEDERGWLRDFAERYDADPDDLLLEEDVLPDGASDTSRDLAAIIDDGECPWCDEYDGENVAQHASSAHPDEWDAYKED